MDDRMGAKVGNSLRKRARRRSHTRKIPIDGFMNMAQVRREIVSALQLHRSSSSTSPFGNNMIINTNKPTTTTLVMSCESISPVPEPIWFTTAPAVLAAVPPAAGDQIIDYFQWPENLSSSYTWWSSFLSSLDGKITSTQISDYPCVDDIMLENSKCPDGTPSADLEAPVLFDANDQNPFPDDWLILPTAEEDSRQLL